MTVQMQWVEVEPGVIPPSYATPIMSEIGDLIGYRVLQYRQKVVVSVDAMRQAGSWETPKPYWSEWIDVPDDT